jgi:GntR family transcriptional repressor for pyruvate dehydrogenase complex
VGVASNKKRRVPEDRPRQPGLWVGYAESMAAKDQRRRTAKTAETIAASIVRDIVARGLQTGDTLPPEAAMLSQYRVARGSLREGLRLLEVQGMIRLKPGPGGGPVVGSVDPQNLARITTLYLHLGGATYADLEATHLTIEPLIAELAARNPDRELVRKQLEPFLQTGLPVEGAAYRLATNSFHGTLHELVGNRMTELLVRVVVHITMTHVIERVDTSGMRERIHQEHRDIARAVIAGQPSKARRLQEEHYTWLWEHYRNVWPARFDELIEWK